MKGYENSDFLHIETENFSGGVYANISIRERVDIACLLLLQDFESKQKGHPQAPQDCEEEYLLPSQPNRIINKINQYHLRISDNGKVFLQPNIWVKTIFAKKRKKTYNIRITKVSKKVYRNSRRTIQQ